jgi:tetratricopeptide (TPR) repeat protein
MAKRKQIARNVPLRERILSGLTRVGAIASTIAGIFAVLSLSESPFFQKHLGPYACTRLLLFCPSGTRDVSTTSKVAANASGEAAHRLQPDITLTREAPDAAGYRRLEMSVPSADPLRLIRQDPSETICDGLAAAPWDNDAKELTQTLVFEVMDTAGAIRACEASTRSSPQNRRYWFQLGRAYDRDRQFEAAKVAYEKAAALGSAAANVNLGVLYAQGQGVEPSDVQAREYYAKAAGLGNAEGMFLFACKLADGVGGKVNKAGAIHWFKMSLASGLTHPESANEALRKLEASP